MGAVLSQVVFQAPEMSTYEVDSEGYIAFEKKPRYENALWMEHPMHFIPTSRGVLVAALFLRVENPQCTILLSHGTSEDIGTTTPWAAELATELNANVLVYDYSGYGKSTTRTTPTSPTSLAVRPSEQNVYSDVEACYRYLVNVERVRPCDILAMGRSLGSGAAVHLATRHPVGGLIIVCGVSSIVRVARPKLTKTPVFDMFTNVDKVPTIKCPILFLHGRRDEVVSFECGLQMYAAAVDAHPHRTPPPLWVDDATHNTLETFNREEIFETYRSFVDNWMRNASLQERIKAEWKAVGVDMTSTEWLSEIPAVDNGASGMEQTVAPQTVLDVLGEPQRDLDEKGLQKMVMHSYSRKAIPTELETAPDGTACVPGDFGSRLTTMSSAGRENRKFGSSRFSKRFSVPDQTRTSSASRDEDPSRLRAISSSGSRRSTVRRLSQRLNLFPALNSGPGPHGDQQGLGGGTRSETFSVDRNDHSEERTLQRAANSMPIKHSSRRRWWRTSASSAKPKAAAGSNF